jgi:hypothetical protein
LENTISRCRPRLFTLAIPSAVKAQEIGLACSHYSLTRVHVDSHLIVQRGIFAPAVADQRCSDEYLRRFTALYIALVAFSLLLEHTNEQVGRQAKDGRQDNMPGADTIDAREILKQNFLHGACLHGSR